MSRGQIEPATRFCRLGPSQVSSVLRRPDGEGGPTASPCPPPIMRRDKSGARTPISPHGQAIEARVFR